MSSTGGQAEDDEEACANCGKPEVDNIKLKDCDDCDLVRYCSVDCQKNHRPHHKKVCKKRMAEIRDDNLFKQPDESYLGECPICCLPHSIDENKLVVNSCCSKRICKGCEYANQKREAERGLKHKCAYCREPAPYTDDEINQNQMKRVKANDPIAILKMGKKCDDEGDYEGAVEYYSKAAELGDMPAHFNLSILYYQGEGVEKDTKKEVYHLEEAAIGGHPTARHNLAAHEGENGRADRAMKHWVIAAKLGCDFSLEAVKSNFQRGLGEQGRFRSGSPWTSGCCGCNKKRTEGGSKQLLQHEQPTKKCKITGIDITVFLPLTLITMAPKYLLYPS
jgi:tetratricopeptide (TPR) repeat protein